MRIVIQDAGKGYGGPRGASRQAKMDCYWPRIQPFGPRHSHDMLTSAWTRFEEGWNPLRERVARVARKSNPLAYLPARRKPYHIRFSSPALHGYRSFVRIGEHCDWITSYEPCERGKEKGDVMDPDEFRIDRRSMLVANSIAFAIWGRGRDNWEGKTGQAFALKESARLIMCFFNEVVELFSLKRIHVETLIKLTEIEICQLLHNRTGNYD